MKQYEYVDEFIADTCSALGDTFAIGDFRGWLDNSGHDVDPGPCLSAHRGSPNKRTFTTERIGLGPSSHYKLVERPEGVSSASVREMHQQQCTEMVNKWANEYRYRMGPVAHRSKKAQAILTQAEAEIKAVATVLSTRLDFLDDEDEDE